MSTAGADVKEIYTDGACSGNPGPGGWGTRIEFADGQVQELGGADKATTNNRMEMQAAISALEFLITFSQTPGLSSCSVILHTDSEYLKNGITKWIAGWKRKGWKTSAGKPVLNKDLWQQLDELTQTLKAENLLVDWRHVRGHAGNPGNERCDEIACAFSHGKPISLKQYQAQKTLQPTAQKVSPKDVQKDVQKDAQQEVQNVTNTVTNKVTTPDSNPDSIEVDSTTASSGTVAHSGVNSNDLIPDHRDGLLGVPEIKNGTLSSPYSIPALKSYEGDPYEGQQSDMVTSSDKQADLSEVSRIERLTNALKTLQVTDELAQQGYLITSAELADLMDVNASAVTSRGDYWAWRNWTVSRIRREGNQILWQLERIDE